jgi:lysophospholipase L1-like esterase
MKTRMKTRMIVFSLNVIFFLSILLLISPIHQAKAEETWDYVILGSSIGTRGWTEYYGDYIETDLGVTIVRHDYYVSDQKASMLLKSLIIENYGSAKEEETLSDYAEETTDSRSEKLMAELLTGSVVDRMKAEAEELRDDIINAEVITIGIGFADMRDAIQLYGAGGSNQPQKITEKLKSFREDYDAILSKIISLSNSNTIIRVMDFYCPYVQSHKDSGIYEDTKRYWMEFNKCIAEVAEKHGIPVAQVFQAMNGVHGDDDPNEKGYLASDGFHLSDEGYKVVAKLVRELGYE